MVIGFVKQLVGQNGWLQDGVDVLHYVCIPPSARPDRAGEDLIFVRCAGPLRGSGAFVGDTGTYVAFIHPASV